MDLTLDSSLRPGDVVATTSGLVAYTGVRLGAGQTADFTPVASYPGLTADVRARLGEMKVAPVIAETVASDAPVADVGRDVLPVTVVPKAHRQERNARKPIDIGAFSGDAGCVTTRQSTEHHMQNRELDFAFSRARLVRSSTFRPALRCFNGRARRRPCM